MPIVAGIGAIGSAIGGGLAAIGGGSALAGAGTVAGIAGQLFGSSGAGSAAASGAEAQVAAAREANALQKYMYDTTRRDNEPWRQTGLQALNRLGALYGFQPSLESVNWADYALMHQDILREFQEGKFGERSLADAGRYHYDMWGQYEQDRTLPGGVQGGRNRLTSGSGGDASGAQSLLAMDPGYQFRLREGINQIDRSAASRGRLMSGGTLKALDRYNQDYASNEFGSAYNRLASLAGIGQTANQQNAVAGQNYANQAGQNFWNAGQARASGYANQAAASNQMWGGITNAATNIFSILGNRAGSWSPGWNPTQAGYNFQGQY